MALTGLHTNWLRGSYTNDRDYEIKKSEGLFLTPYYDLKANSVAIGYGYDLLKGDDVATIKSNLSNIGITLSNNDEQLLKDYRDGKKTLQNVLDNLTLTLPSESKASDLLALVVNKFETQLNTVLGYSMAQSRERAALISIAYNGGIGLLQGSTPGGSIADAVINDDRIRAWYLIRYRRNGGDSRSQGIANRRYRESDLFGLWNNGGPTTPEIQKFEEFLKQADPYNTGISMLQYMRNYEAGFTPKTAEANNSRTIDEQINNESAVKNYFVSQYGRGENINGNVILGTELANKVLYTENALTISQIKAGYLKSTENNDLILGDKGADELNGGPGIDVIYGGEGNDIITGGTGDDLIYGGEGNDTYYINTGDGVDTVEDKQGKNTVIINGKVVGDMLKQSNGIWKSADGEFTGAYQGTNFLVTQISTGTSVILNENFESGDFGINLLDAPVDPDTSEGLVIEGDFTPIDFDYEPVTMRRAA